MCLRYMCALCALLYAVVLRSSAPPRAPAAPRSQSAPQRTVEPDLVLEFSSDLMGFVEPCGCTTGQYGGIGRRATYLRQARQKPTPHLALFAGDLVAGTGELDHIRAETLISALAAMKYDAAVPGEMDLLEGEAVFRKRWCGLGFAVSANLVDAEGKRFLPQYLVRQVSVRRAGGARTVKVAITGVVAPFLVAKVQELSGLSLDWVKAEDPTSVLKQIVPKLRKEAPLVVVLAHTGIPAAAQLAKDVPGIDVMVAGHNPAVSILSPPNLGGPILVAAGDRGRHITELRLKLAADGRVDAYSTSQTALGDVIPDDPEVGRLMETYRTRAAEYGRRTRAALAAKRTEQAGPYVGWKVCAMCHASATAQWKSTKHADALAALKKWHPSAAERMECLQCHVVGLGDPYGYIGERETPDLAGVQCENCHGPGRRHVEAAWLNKPSAGLLTKSPGEAVCRSCHDDEHHPKFDFAASIGKVTHR